MMKVLVLLIGLGVLGFAATGHAEVPPQVVLETNHGRIVIELDSAKAPITVKSFLDNVEAGIYDGSIFHRVIPNFMVQGGGFTKDFKLIETEKTLTNEADNGLKNLRGTVAMARKGDPHSASIQFFINVVDNGFLDHTAKTQQGWGYTVFGRVVEGIEVADAIAAVPRGRVGSMGDVPNEAVVIESVKRIPAEDPATPE